MTKARDQSRFGWTHTGRARPSFADVPADGQESVWDYPRPPILVPDRRHVEVRLEDLVVADTRRAWRVLETASPPTFYIPPDDARMDLLVPAPGTSSCEWKGRARYWSVHDGERIIPEVAWSYADPRAAFEAIRDHPSFYPGKLACYVDGERVRPQPGGFYGGWVTSEILGPYKGEPGTGGW